MSGTGGINLERPSVQIWWETGDGHEGVPVIVKAVNAITGQIGIKLDVNDGFTNLSYPPGFQGVDLISVVNAHNGKLIAQFTISVKVPA